MRHVSWSRRGLTVIGVVLAMTTGSVASAPASSDETQAPDQVLGVVDSMLGAGGRDGAIESSGARLPATAEDPLEITSDLGAPTWRMSLPSGLERTPVLADSEQAIYRATDRAFDVVAKLGDGGFGAIDAYVLVVINSSVAPSAYEFELELPAGTSLSPTSEGGVEIVDKAGEPIGYIHPPWAVDATGAPVETRFEVHGTTLTQTVGHEGARYPVIADPAVQSDCGWVTCTIRFDRARTHFIGFSGQSVANIAVAVCALLSGGGAIALCIAAIGAIGWAISSHARNYYNNGNCYGVKYYLPSGVPAWSHQVQRGTYNCN